MTGFKFKKKTFLKSPVLNDCDSVLKMGFIHTYICTYKMKNLRFCLQDKFAGETLVKSQTFYSGIKEHSNQVVCADKYKNFHSKLFLFSERENYY